MRIDEIEEKFETAILEAPMLEMANLAPSDTGLPVVIWFGEVGGQHGPRIKVSNIKGKFSKTDNFVVQVSKDAIILTPRSVKLKSYEVDLIQDWIKINYDTLMLMWIAFETGESAIALIASLQKI
jgi:hypothetical protein